MNQINLREAPMVDKPVEGATLFALNPDGSVNRIKADGVGGGKIAKVVADLESLYGTGQVSTLSPQNIRDGVSTLASDSEPKVITATCENMTFEEACAIVKAGEKLDVIVTGNLDVIMPGMIATGYAVGALYISESEGNAKASNVAQPESVSFATHALMNNVTFAWVWTADGISANIF